MRGTSDPSGSEAATNWVPPSLSQPSVRHWFLRTGVSVFWWRYMFIVLRRTAPPSGPQLIWEVMRGDRSFYGWWEPARFVYLLWISWVYFENMWSLFTLPLTLSENEMIACVSRRSTPEGLSLVTTSRHPTSAAVSSFISLKCCHTPLPNYCPMPLSYAVLMHHAINPAFPHHTSAAQIYPCMDRPVTAGCACCDWCLLCRTGR